MKKIKSLISIMIVFTFVALLWSFIISCKNLHFYIEQVKYFSSLGLMHEEEVIHAYIMPTVEYSILVFLNAVTIPSCVFLFIYCNPRLFRLSTWTNVSEEWAQNKAERLARKEAKAKDAKQKRIEELQAEIDALKKDDLPPSDK